MLSLPAPSPKLGTARWCGGEWWPSRNSQILQMGFSSPHRPSEHSVHLPRAVFSLWKEGRLHRAVSRALPEPLCSSPEKLPVDWGKRRWGMRAWPAFPPPSAHTPLPTQAHLRAPSHTASLPPLFSHRPRRPVQAHRGHAAAGPGGVQGHFGGAHLPAGRHGGHPQPLHPAAGCLAARPPI